MAVNPDPSRRAFSASSRARCVVPSGPMETVKSVGLWVGFVGLSVLLTACPDEKAAAPSKEPAAAAPEAAEKKAPEAEDKSGAPAAEEEEEEGGW